MINNEFYNDEFEQLLKEKADQFSMYPSRRVWHSIYNNLHPGRRWPSVVMSMLLISSLILIGYLNTGENSITRQINSNASANTKPEKNVQISTAQIIVPEKQASVHYITGLQPEMQYSNAFADFITNQYDLYNYIVVKSNRPVYLSSAVTPSTTDTKAFTESAASVNTDVDIIQTVNNYIKSNRIFADIAGFSKKDKNNAAKAGEDALRKNNQEQLTLSSPDNINESLSSSGDNTSTETNKAAEAKTTARITAAEEDKNIITNEDKAWIENYAMQNKPAAKRWKGRLGYQIYITPAVNYRKLTTKSKGSTTAFATADINNVISQKPGFGFEAGLGLNYALTRRLILKAGAQFNYTNYNIAADRASHPVVTTILLNDPATGYSYPAARTSTTSNTFNTAATSPVTLHNRTYQVSVPIGFGYKISSQNNVEWFAGASVQPTYYFGGRAHLISSDLKSYVSEPSSINSFNLNLGFETYMNFKMGTYNIQVGPQVRYQVNSTYRKDVALIEKPYAVGLRFGLTKGF
jgi:hypothetical protein